MASDLKPHIVCRGCWILGNNCGECSRCVETALAFALFARREFRLAKDVANALEEVLAGKEEACRLDHNGFCQEHASRAPCVVAEAREALRKWKETPT